MQPAPIQISYMGFPGTTGADYIHYLVTDEVGRFDFGVSFNFISFCLMSWLWHLWLQFVSPSRCSHIYSEKLVHLPHCYFVNDYKQVCDRIFLPSCLYVLLSISGILLLFHIWFLEKLWSFGSQVPIQEIQLWFTRRQIYFCMLQPALQDGSWYFQYMVKFKCFINVIWDIVSMLPIIFIFASTNTGAISLSESQTVHFGFLDFRLLARQDSATVLAFFFNVFIVHVHFRWNVFCCACYLFDLFSILLFTDAAQRGVQPDQIIFTDVAMKGEHIRRSALADLFLDT